MKNLKMKSFQWFQKPEKPSENSSPASNNGNSKKLELPKLTIQTSSDEIIESILSAEDVSDDDTEEDIDAEYKPMNDGELSTMIEKRTMDFRTDDAEYLDFIEKLKVPSKIANAKFVKRCETEEITGCLAFEGDYAGFFNNRKLWNNAKNGTILIEQLIKRQLSLKEKLANVCEWYSYIRLIQNKVIKKNPKLIYSDLLDIKRKLFYSKNGITFKYQN
eukprot:jgi/Orpsp1_1/1181886/evm.model.c7180000079028.1